jgi:dihydrodipicolinate synthase/N-acetylneuraminate lyase
MNMKTAMTRRELIATLGVVAAVPRLTASEHGKTMRGVFPIMATPYTESKAVDYEDLAREVEYLDRCKVPGMVWPQLFGETFELTREERLRGMEVIAKATRGRKPAVVLGVQGANLKEAMVYLEAAEKLDVDALIALPPTEVKTIGEWTTYFRTLANATKRPFFIQNWGGVAVKPTVPQVMEVVRQCPNAGYLKEEIEPAIERMVELSKHRPAVKRVFAGGGGRSMIYEMRLGFDGVMAGNAYADVLVQIWDLWKAGEQARAREVFSKLILILNCEQYITGVREYVMKRRRIFKTMVSRRRNVQLSKEAVLEIEFCLEALQPYFKV